MILRSKISFNIIVTAIMFAAFSLCSFAGINTVSSVNVKQDTVGNIKVLIKTEKDTKIKKSYDGDSLVITVNSALPSNSAEIINDNTPGIRNITLQKKNSDNTLIIIQGDNIRGAQIYLKDAVSGQTTEVGGENGIFYIADKKLLAGFSVILLLGYLFIFAYGKNAKRTDNELLSGVKENLKKTEAVTLRHKAMQQRGNVPSINAQIGGKFVSPVIAHSYAYEDDNVIDKIRKAG